MQQSPYLIDQINVYEDIGEETFKKLSRVFYTKVYNDTEVWFRDMFKDRPFEDAIQNQYEFFIQRMGGPPLYSERKGHPALKARHRTFHITPRAAKRWLHHMHESIEEIGIPEKSKKAMLQFLDDTADFLINRPPDDQNHQA